MLQDAESLRGRNVAVVLGFIETHGRADTQALMNDLESVPRKMIEYHGVVLEEMDVDAILARGDLATYHLAHSARADLCRRLGRTVEARASYERALGLARQEPERQFLERRLGELR